jgi:hypothetical protein
MGSTTLKKMLMVMVNGRFMTVEDLLDWMVRWDRSDHQVRKALLEIGGLPETPQTMTIRPPATRIPVEVAGEGSECLS